MRMRKPLVATVDIPEGTTLAEDMARSEFRWLPTFIEDRDFFSAANHAAGKFAVASFDRGDFLVARCFVSEAPITVGDQQVVIPVSVHADTGKRLRPGMQIALSNGRVHVPPPLTDKAMPQGVRSPSYEITAISKKGEKQEEVTLWLRLNIRDVAAIPLLSDPEAKWSPIMVIASMAHAEDNTCKQDKAQETHQGTK